MSAPLLKKWGHMRAAPFYEIAGLLEQQDAALARSGAQLQEGTKKLIEAATLCRAADARIVQLLTALKAAGVFITEDTCRHDHEKAPVLALINSAIAKAVG